MCRILFFHKSLGYSLMSPEAGSAEDYFIIAHDDLV